MKGMDDMRKKKIEWYYRTANILHFATVGAMVADLYTLYRAIYVDKISVLEPTSGLAHIAIIIALTAAALFANYLADSLEITADALEREARTRAAIHRMVERERRKGA